MSYSSIIKKTCKCGCGKMPSIGYAGYNSGCRLDLVKDKIDRQSERQAMAIKKEYEGGRVDDLSGLEDDLDMVVSRIVRIGEADSNGNVSCFTCGATNHFTKMQCGHFIPRANKALRWELTNLRTQCVSCNEHKNGNLKVFAEKLDKENPGTSEWLKEQSRQPVKYYRHELKQILLGYRAKLKIIEQKLKK